MKSKKRNTIKKYSTKKHNTKKHYTKKHKIKKRFSKKGKTKKYKIKKKYYNKTKKKLKIRKKVIKGAGRDKYSELRYESPILKKWYNMYSSQINDSDVIIIDGHGSILGDDSININSNVLMTSSNLSTKIPFTTGLVNTLINKVFYNTLYFQTKKNEELIGLDIEIAIDKKNRLVTIVDIIRSKSNKLLYVIQYKNNDAVVRKTLKYEDIIGYASIPQIKKDVSYDSKPKMNIDDNIKLAEILSENANKYVCTESSKRLDKIKSKIENLRIICYGGNKLMWSFNEFERGAFISSRTPKDKLIECGLKPGDKLEKINEIEVDNMTRHQINHVWISTNAISKNTKLTFIRNNSVGGGNISIKNKNKNIELELDSKMSSFVPLPKPPPAQSLSSDPKLDPPPLDDISQNMSEPTSVQSLSPDPELDPPMLDDISQTELETRKDYSKYSDYLDTWYTPDGCIINFTTFKKKDKIPNIFIQLTKEEGAISLLDRNNNITNLHSKDELQHGEIDNFLLTDLIREFNLENKIIILFSCLNKKHDTSDSSSLSSTPESNSSSFEAEPTTPSNSKSISDWNSPEEHVSHLKPKFMIHPDDDVETFELANPALGLLRSNSGASQITVGSSNRDSSNEISESEDSEDLIKVLSSSPDDN